MEFVVRLKTALQLQGSITADINSPDNKNPLIHIQLQVFQKHTQPIQEKIIQPRGIFVDYFHVLYKGHLLQYCTFALNKNNFHIRRTDVFKQPICFILTQFLWGSRVKTIIHLWGRKKKTVLQTAQYFSTSNMDVEEETRNTAKWNINTQYTKNQSGWNGQICKCSVHHSVNSSLQLYEYAEHCSRGADATFFCPLCFSQVCISRFC